NAMSSKNVPIALTEVFAKGGEGGVELAQKVISAIESSSAQADTFRYTYDLELPLKDKITEIAQKVYSASKVNFDLPATQTLRMLEKNGYGNLPICIAKTQYSFSDNAKLLGAPTGFEVNIKQVRLSAGAGFVVALAGDIMTMPGLPAKPSAQNIDINDDGTIVGLF
ncbi:MAG: formate--tetrahydrofolate ligase, partial [Defluviitaleaceae bacterium]|nr:formate--tetrahydrofolate ligase [Defluviitaleaceae bacterium]